MLLPPSEGKTSPAAGVPLDLAALSSPALTPLRERVLRSLEQVSSGNPKRAMDRLGLGPTQLPDLERNARLREAPTARADALYTGVLYAAWDPAGTTPATRRHAEGCVAICSALFGVVRPGDLIPAYRLSATVTLPRLGPVAGLWRKPLGLALAEMVDDGLLVDLRSGAYVNLHKPTGDLGMRTVAVRVLSEAAGVRKVVSHFNKHTKGELVRAIAESGERATTPAEFGDLVGSLGWTTELAGNRLDVII
jgi:cytoplasmic iron level regulating protein YaaA (DUF328/UPF0246 family)